jgi:tetratricopeptide (TPR) repeat protein
MRTLAMVLSRDADFLQLAVSHYDTALEFRPGAVRILCDLGMTYLLLGKKDKAIEKFTAALKSDPTSATAAYHLGLALEAQGQEHDALSTWEEFLTTRTAISDHDEWSTNMRKAVSRVKFAMTNLAQRESE